MTVSLFIVMQKETFKEKFIVVLLLRYYYKIINNIIPGFRILMSGKETALTKVLQNSGLKFNK